MAKKRIMIHSAVTIMPEEFTIGVLANGKPNVITQGQEQEICQFAAEFYRWPMPISVFNQAFDEMKARCLAAAQREGLVKV